MSAENLIDQFLRTQAIGRRSRADYAYILRSFVQFEQKLADAGVKFTSPDRGPFQKAVEPFYKEWGDKYAGNELIKRIREA